MISRKLLAALVGISLATGALGAASAQTGGPATRQSAPITAGAPTTPTTTVHRKAHPKHMSKRTAPKHLSHRAHKGTKLGQLVGKRIRVSHAGKRGLGKHV